MSFTSFGFFKYKPRYEFGHLKLRRCLGQLTDGWMDGWMDGWLNGRTDRFCLVCLLVDCLPACLQLLSLSTCFTPLDGALPATTTSTTTTMKKGSNNHSFVFDNHCK